MNVQWELSAPINLCKHIMFITPMHNKFDLKHFYNFEGVLAKCSSLRVPCLQMFTNPRSIRSF